MIDLATEYENARSARVDNIERYNVWFRKDFDYKCKYMNRSANTEWLTKKYGEPTIWDSFVLHSIWKINHNGMFFWVLVSEEGTSIEYDTTHNIQNFRDIVMDFCETFYQDSREYVDHKFEENMIRFKEEGIGW